VKNLFLVKPVAEALLEESTLKFTRGLTLETSPFHVKHAHILFYKQEPLIPYADAHMEKPFACVICEKHGLKHTFSCEKTHTGGKPFPLHLSGDSMGSICLEEHIAITPLIARQRGQFKGREISETSEEFEIYLIVQLDCLNPSIHHTTYSIPGLDYIG